VRELCAELDEFEVDRVKTCIRALEGSLEDCDRVILSRNIV
jgi:hypothetical protein